MKCTSCGSEIPGGTNQCEYCGATCPPEEKNTSGISTSQSANVSVDSNISDVSSTSDFLKKIQEQEDRDGSDTQKTLMFIVRIILYIILTIIMLLIISNCVK